MAKNWFQLEILITCQNSEMAHFLSSTILRWLKIRREIEFDAKIILSYLRIFELKKVSHLRILTRDRYFELKSIFSHLKITCIFRLNSDKLKKIIFKPNYSLYMIFAIFLKTAISRMTIFEKRIKVIYRMNSKKPEIYPIYDLCDFPLKMTKRA